MSSLEFVVPGDPSTPTGGYIYDREIVRGLAALGWRTALHSLDASFPRPTGAALRHARELLGALPHGALVVMDGLALPGLDRVLETQTNRLALVALVHHPVALETGLDASTARLLEADEKRALALVARVITTSQWTARALARYDVPIERIRVVEPGVDPRGEAHSFEHCERGHAHGTVNLLCVGTLTQRKGHAVLLDALADLRDRKWHLTCAGSLTRDHETTAAVQRQIERLRLGERVSLLGDLDAATLERHYARADLFVLPSYFEGYGMALAEAVARGLPVVSTTGGAIPETVPEGAGLLVPPGDSRALSKALATLLDDADARRELAARASEARSALPTWRGAAEKFAAALANLAARA